MGYNATSMITKDSKRILVADDDEFYRVKLSYVLTKAGHEAKCVNDGRGVIEELKNDGGGFDLLILDLQMPKVDGYEVLEWMRDDNLTVRFPVLAITGVYDPTHILKRLKTLGAAGLITKALSPEQVIHKVNRLLFPDMEPQGKPRVPISIPADFTIQSYSFTGRLLNIDAGGLFLHTTEELQRYTNIQLKFTLPGYDTMKLNGVVKWYKGYSGEKRFFSGAGITFPDLSQNAEEVLEQFVKREISKLGLNE
jgi:CheY-like chemotaxis protein